MQAVRFKEYFGGLYYVYYRTIPVGILMRTNKNRWSLFSVNLIFCLEKYVFKSLKDAKRYSRIRLNKFDFGWMHFVKRLELNNSLAEEQVKDAICKIHEAICNEEKKILEANE